LVFRIDRGTSALYVIGLCFAIRTQLWLNRNASGVRYSQSDPEVVFTLWDDVLTALREGEAPQQSDVLAEIATRLPQLKSFDT
jgi:hypothetical protein